MFPTEIGDYYGVGFNYHGHPFHYWAENQVKCVILTVPNSFSTASSFGDLGTSLALGEVVYDTNWWWISGYTPGEQNNNTNTNQEMIRTWRRIEFGFQAVSNITEIRFYHGNNRNTQGNLSANSRPGYLYLDEISVVNASQGQSF